MDSVPRLLINREAVGTDEQPILKLLGFVDDRALDFNDDTRYRDACFLGDCDAGVTELAALLDDAFAAAQQDKRSSDAPASSSADGSHAQGESWVAALRRRIETHPPAAPRLPAVADAPAAASTAVANAAPSAGTAASEPTPSDLPIAATPSSSTGYAAAQMERDPAENKTVRSDEEEDTRSPDAKAARLS